MPISPSGFEEDLKLTLKAIENPFVCEREIEPDRIG
jgi:hypothetical protein